MQRNTSVTKRIARKLLGFYAAVFVFVVLCSHIATQIGSQDSSHSVFCSTKERDVKPIAHVNEMLFSLKSFILFE